MDEKETIDGAAKCTGVVFVQHRKSATDFTLARNFQHILDEEVTTVDACTMKRKLIRELATDLSVTKKQSIQRTGKTSFETFFSEQKDVFSGRIAPFLEESDKWKLGLTNKTHFESLFPRTVISTKKHEILTRMSECLKNCDREICGGCDKRNLCRRHNDVVECTDCRRLGVREPTLFHSKSCADKNGYRCVECKIHVTCAKCVEADREWQNSHGVVCALCNKFVCVNCRGYEVDEDNFFVPEADPCCDDHSFYGHGICMACIKAEKCPECDKIYVLLYGIDG